MYQSKNFDYLFGAQGFSDTLLKNHFTLYQGYVTNTNKIMETLETFAREGKTNTPEYAELKRRFGWEWNGMRLHELYFGNMAKICTPIGENSPLLQNIKRIYGTYADWEKDFRTVATMRGIGWAILYYDLQSNELFNVWVNEHDMGHLAGATPLLVLDVFEHAYVLDYGLKRADYIDAFFNAIDWNVVNERFK